MQALPPAQTLAELSAEQTLVRVLRERSKLHPPVADDIAVMDEASRIRHVAIQACVDTIDSNGCALFAVDRKNGNISPRLLPGS